MELCQFHKTYPQEFKSYTAGIAAYMSYCGHHSWYETACVLKKFGVDYDAWNRFFSIIPPAVLLPEKLEEMIKPVSNSMDEHSFSAEC